MGCHWRLVVPLCYRSRIMKHSVSHDLSLDVAKQVAQKALEAYRDRFAEYNPTITWAGDHLAEVSFKVKGVSLKGTFEILKDSIDMDMEVPFLLRMFKQKAVDVVDGEIRSWIGKAKNGSL